MSFSSIIRRTWKRLRVFHIPTKIVTNLAIGGKHEKDLFITTARRPYNLFTGQVNQNESITSSAGSLFILRNAVCEKGFNGRALQLRN